MKSLTFYVSTNTKELYDTKNTLENEYGISPIMFPENNRHPVVQVEWVKEKLLNFDSVGNVVVMTHSATIISCIGDYIADIDPEFRHKVKIVILNDYDDENVQHSTFNREGFLEDWPVGFFNW